MEPKRIKEILDKITEDFQTDFDIVSYFQQDLGMTYEELVELGYRDLFKRAFADPHKWD